MELRYQVLDVTTVPQVIRADEGYSVAEFRRRAGLGDYAFREVRRAGLRIIAIGKKRYVLGVDWLDFLAKEAQKGEDCARELDETNTEVDTDKR